MADVLKAALAYATKLNYKVIPLYSIKNGKCTCGNTNCNSPGKHPRIEQWGQRSSGDPAQISTWFDRWPESNIGVVTGARSGFIVLDIDTKRGGDDSLYQLEKELGKLPDTVTQLTGGGGRRQARDQHGQRSRQMSRTEFFRPNPSSSRSVDAGSVDHRSPSTRYR